jgi:hypothetical protein
MPHLSIQTRIGIVRLELMVRAAMSTVDLRSPAMAALPYVYPRPKISVVRSSATTSIVEFHDNVSSASMRPWELGRDPE